MTHRHDIRRRQLVADHPWWTGTWIQGKPVARALRRIMPPGAPQSSSPLLWFGSALPPDSVPGTLKLTAVDCTGGRLPSGQKPNAGIAFTGDRKPSVHYRLLTKVALMSGYSSGCTWYRRGRGGDGRSTN